MYEYIYNGIWVAEVCRKATLVDASVAKAHPKGSTIEASAGSNPAPYPFYKKVGQKYLTHKGLFCILLIR